MARPTKLTPAVLARITLALRDGIYAEQAAAVAGVHRATYYRWLAQGREASTGIYHDFYDAVVHAEAESELAAIRIVRVAAEKHWQAAGWWLERRYPHRWGRADRLDPQDLLRTEAEKVARERNLPVEEVVDGAQRIFEER
jgi:hypothetical protein